MSEAPLYPAPYTLPQQILVLFAIEALARSGQVVVFDRQRVVFDPIRPPVGPSPLCLPYRGASPIRNRPPPRSLL